MQRLFKPLSLIIICLAVVRCSPETKQNLGFVKQMPDEYKIMKYDDLALPDQGGLPTPGHPVDNRRKKIVTQKTSSLLMEGIKTGGQPMHPSEVRLLKALNVGPNKEIYNHLNKDFGTTLEAENRWQNKVKDTILFWKKSNKKKAKVIDAEKEAQSLKTA